MAAAMQYLGCLFVTKAGVKVYLWCQISKGKTKIILGSLDVLNKAIVTLLDLQKKEPYLVRWVFEIFLQTLHVFHILT